MWNKPITAAVRVLLGILVFAALPALAQVQYHVAQQHRLASDGNPGTAEQPWLTIQHAAEVVQPGDSVIVHAGEYRETAAAFPPYEAVIRLRQSGTEQSPIRFVAAEGEEVVIDPQNGGPGFLLIGIDHVTIQGFEIRNARVGGVWTTIDGSDGVQVLDNHIHAVSARSDVEPEDRDNVGGVRLDGCSGCLVRGNEIHDVEVPPDVGGGNASNGGGVISFNMQDSDIEHNLIYNSYNGVMHKRSTGGPGARIRRNIFHAVTNGVYYLHAGAGDPPHVDPLVEQNHVYDCDYGVYAIVHESETASRGFTFRDNVLRCDVGLFLQGAQDVSLSGNMIVAPIYALALRRTEGRPVEIDSSDRNLFSPRGRFILDERGQMPPAEPDFDTLAQWQQAMTLDAGSLEADPVFRFDEPGQAWLQPGAGDARDFGPHAGSEQVLGPQIRRPAPPAGFTMQVRGV